MPQLNARQVINLAREVIREAGYEVSRISSTEYDDEEEMWIIEANSGSTLIKLEINPKGEVEDFSTED